MKGINDANKCFIYFIHIIQNFFAACIHLSLYAIIVFSCHVFNCNVTQNLI